jgi:HAE1 family hydrophobic/amphiphilic exporter-1
LENGKAVMELDLASMDIVEVRMNVVSLLNQVNGGSYAFTVIKLKGQTNR